MSVKTALRCVTTRGAKAKGEKRESENFRRAAASTLFAKKCMGLMELMGLMGDFMWAFRFEWSGSELCQFLSN